MSVWGAEVVRIDGQLMAAVKIQDDWTGNISLHIRKMYLDGNTYYCNVLKNRVNMTDKRALYLQYEERIKDALKWYDQTKYGR